MPIIYKGRGPRKPLKQGRNGTRSINAQLKELQDAVEAGGEIEPGVAVANATDEASAVTQLNALLASLRTAGIIAS